MKKYIKFNCLWDWTDFGLMLWIYKTTKWATHKMYIDIQLFWLNIWIGVNKRRG